MKKRLSYLLAFILSIQAVTAQEELTGFFQVDTGVLLLEITGGLLILGSFLVIPMSKNLDDTGKKILFMLLVIPTVLSSLYFAGAIVYENTVSETGGPVHWHADYQVWVCGERLDLEDPEFPSNKIGEPLFHEHDDDRIHVEGTVLATENVDLGSYFETIGGRLEDGHLQYRAKSGFVDMQNGDTCPDGSEGNLNVYVNGERIEDYEDYLYYPASYVPPGDCIIVEFGPGNSSTTDKVCSSWEAEGWSYEDYKRPKKTVGGETWQ